MLNRHGLRAKKSWGQCFLHDPSVVKKIVESSGIGREDTVVEIGAGLGAMTRVVASEARQVIAIERDRDLVDVLRKELSDASNVEIVAANALTYDFTSLPRRPVVVGNLPYNISSPLLFHLLAQASSIVSATLMFQQEVAERIVARPGTKAYGVPSVFCRQVATAEKCFWVSRQSFTPRPRVDSTVIRLEMRAAPLSAVNGDRFQQVVRAAFGARRKTLRKALTRQFPVEAVDLALEQIAMDGRRRGETLDVLEFSQLSDAMDRALVVGGDEG